MVALNTSSALSLLEMQTAPLGTKAPARLSPAPKTHAILRTVAANLPEIMIINMIIWVAAIAAILSFAGMFPGPLIGTPIFAILFGAPAVWGSWQTIKLALKPEEPDHPPASTSESE